MYLDSIKEVYYLMRFKAAIAGSNLVKAAVYLEKQKEASDKVENALKETLDGVKQSLNKQKNMMDDLMKELK